MKEYEKQVLQAQLDNEKKVLKDLKKHYQEALESINEKIKLLQADELTQSKIYQIEYQKVLKSQISTYLDLLQDKEYDTIEAYLKESYNNGYMGTLYSIQKQGVPLILPMNQEQIVQAIQLDSKISEGLYTKLGYNVKELKTRIRAEVSRGISTGLMYGDIARNISNLANMDMNKSMRIARTEGHRVQCQASQDACVKAKDKGADVLKQWDATLDGRTRDSHRMVDGELVEIDEKFSNGLKFPGDSSGKASEVVNCRCALLQRARWALDEEELETLKDKARELGVYDEKVDTFEDYKKRFLEASDKVEQEYKGLSAKIGSKDIPEHEEPILLKNIEYSNKQAVKNELQNFEKSAITESVETACVITKDGEVYHCFGVKDRVFPDYDLKEKLIGASVSHNHPIEETSYSFSGDDLKMFLNYKLDVLRGCDELYTYEFTRNAEEIDIEPENWMNVENFQHALMIREAKLHRIGYRRWKNG